MQISTWEITTGSFSDLHSYKHAWNFHHWHSGQQQWSQFSVLITAGFLKKAKPACQAVLLFCVCGDKERQKAMNGRSGESKALLLGVWLLCFRAGFHSPPDWPFSKLLSEASVGLGALYIQELHLSLMVNLGLSLSCAAALPGPFHLLSSFGYWCWPADWNYWLDPGHVMSLWT